MLLKSMLVFLLALGCNTISYAQQARLKAAASKTTLNVGDRFRVEFTVNAGGDQFQAPSFKGFRVLSGPNQSTNMQFVNGRSSYSISFAYVLMATTEGEYKIGPAAIKVGNELVKSNILNIKVLKGSSNAQSGNQQQGNTAQKQAASTGNANLFIIASSSNNNPYVGEPITATYKLYFNQSIVQSSASAYPSFTGFWSEGIDVQKIKQEVEYVNGVKYNVATLTKSVLIAQRSGDLILDPLEIDLVIQQAVQSRSRNLFDQFFGNVKNVKVTSKSKPVKIKVQPLPSGRPASFDGAVGKFTVKITADRNQVKSNEAVNMKYLISGKGNIKLLDEPSISFPSDFEVYDPKVSDQITVNGSGMSGQRAYNYLLIPRHNGEFEVEPPAFTYFDPSKKKYITISNEMMRFSIEKGEEEESNTVNFSGSNKEEIKHLGSDIRYIKTSTTLLNVGYSFFGSWMFYILWLIPIPLFLIFWKFKSILDEKRGDAMYMQRSRASKMAEKRLSKAKKMMSAGDDHAFYEEVFKALYGFFGDKFNLKTTELNKEKIEEILTETSMNKEMIAKTIDILNQCEMARFAPTSDVDREKVYNDSVVLLSGIQKNLK